MQSTFQQESDAFYAEIARQRAALEDHAVRIARLETRFNEFERTLRVAIEDLRQNIDLIVEMVTESEFSENRVKNR
jgi:hypothetical protein